MIVRMKHLDLVCLTSEREATLEKLRALGAVHLDLNAADSPGIRAALERFAEAEKAVRLILRARGKTSRDDLDVRERAISDILSLAEEATALRDECTRLEHTIKQYEPYGDFDPTLAQKLLSRGIPIQDVLPEKLPPKRLSALCAERDSKANRVAVAEAKLAACDEQAILKRYPALRETRAFEQAKALLESKGAVSVVSGWIPETLVADLRAQNVAWGLLLRDPQEGEQPPTLIRPPRLFRPVRVLFDGLGIAPAYDESDVSVPFMCYFSLFFAMLVGDGAYGAIFLAATVAFRRRLARSWFVLLLVFSLATVAWGVLSNTWFGAGLPWCANWPTVRWLADPSYANMMLLCFTIGASHLMLARIWNGLCKLNDTTCVAEFGWAGVILFMYLVTNAIVGIFSGVPTWSFYVFGVSLMAVFGFSVKPSELKTRGAELGMLPLNVMSALGDVISYVRLFAVSFASVKVAENFNNMAIGLVADADSWWAKGLFALVMVAILVVGHALNLAMAGLSILVHAVRLNTLEFSNHKGVSWAGYAFKPFQKEDKKNE